MTDGDNMLTAPLQREQGINASAIGCFEQERYLHGAALGRFRQMIHNYLHEDALGCPSASRLFEQDRYLHGAALGGFRQVTHNYLNEDALGCPWPSPLFEQERYLYVSGR